VTLRNGESEHMKEIEGKEICANVNITGKTHRMISIGHALHSLCRVLLQILLNYISLVFNTTNYLL